MFKPLVRRIISIFFFVLSVFLMWQIFDRLSEHSETKTLTLLFILLLASVSGLFLSAILFQTGNSKGRDLSKNELEPEKEKEKAKSNTEDKLKRIMDVLQNRTSDKPISEEILQLLAQEFYIVQGLVYIKQGDIFTATARYAIERNRKIPDFKPGVGIHGQVAKDKKIRRINDIPEDYIQVVSGLGAGFPEHLIFIPLVDNNETSVLIELASFDEFPNDFEKYFPALNAPLLERFKNILND